MTQLLIYVTQWNCASLEQPKIWHGWICDWCYLSVQLHDPLCFSSQSSCVFFWWSQPSGSENPSVKPWSGVIIIYIHTCVHICMHTEIFEFDLTGKPFHGFWAFLCNYMEDRNSSKNINRKKRGFSYNHMLSKAKVWKNSTYTTKTDKIMTGCLVIKLFYCILQREGWYHLSLIMVRCSSGFCKTPFPLGIFPC